MQKKYFIIFIFGAVLTVFSMIGVKSFAQNLEGYVVEGESLDGIMIGKSTADDVIAVYGTDYKLINHRGYSYEMIYKNLGLAFYYCQADPNKEIFVIEIEPPFRATTKSGIVLGESTMADVFRIYAEVEETWVGLEYDGIYFYAEVNNDGEDREDARTEPQIVENTESTNKELEILPGGFVIDGQSGSESSRVVGFETEVNGVSNPIYYSENNQINKVESENQADSTSENDQVDEAEKALKAKVVKRIELIEKDGLRQCMVKFPRN